MVQHITLERFLSMSKDDVRGNGWLSRSIVTAPLSRCGYRQTAGMEYSTKGLQVFNDRIHELLSETACLGDDIPKKVVKFSDEAKRIFLDIYNDIEINMRPEGLFYWAKDHASKLSENIARVAALIHCFDNPPYTNIPVPTLLEAVNLVAYYSGHFMTVFCSPPKYVIDAENLKHWLRVYVNSGVRYIKRNDILQRGPSAIRKKKDFEAALDYLKSDTPIGELVSGKTRVIDLWPQHPFDGSRLANDLK